MNLGTRSTHSELEADGASAALRLLAQAPGTDAEETLYEAQARSSRLPAWEDGGVSQFLPPPLLDLPSAWIYTQIFFPLGKQAKRAPPQGGHSTSGGMSRRCPCHPEDLTTTFYQPFPSLQ